MDKEDTEYMLRWSEHNPHVMGSFHQLWEHNLLTDVTLATEERTFQAHKLLLSACSPYFRHLFINNPCKHPTVFLKDVPERHMELLLEYMYQGKIAVKHQELAQVLKTASSLKIRGLTTPESDKAGGHPDVPPLLMDDADDNHENEAGMDKFHQIETASNHSAASVVSANSRKAEGGRKSSKPKKLRLSGDTDSDVISPRYPCSLQEKSIVSPVEEVDDNIADDNDEEKELVIDQPMDFSKGDKTCDTKYSILGSYLKSHNGNKSTKSSSDLSDNLRRAGLGSGWMNSLSSLTTPRPASRDSRGYSKEDEEIEENTLEDKVENKDYPQLSLSETMGMGDIAERLRTHFLSNLPSPSYNWLANSPNTLLNKVKREKHPSGPGGIKTDMIGPNGKAAVKCEECGKLLADPSSLYRHRKIHTGEKPHKCPYCDRRFIQRFNMKQHIKTHRIELLAEQNGATALNFAQ